MKSGTGLAWRAADAPAWSPLGVDSENERNPAVDELPAVWALVSTGMWSSPFGFAGPCVRFECSAIVEL
jgi:hypothetical protein